MSPQDAEKSACATTRIEAKNRNGTVSPVLSAVSHRILEASVPMHHAQDARSPPLNEESGKARRHAQLADTNLY